MKINLNETKVLEVLADHYGYEGGECLTFAGIASFSDLDVKAIRRSARSLARKGLAEYVRGLFDDEGNVAGSGYCATRNGRDAMKEILACNERR